jgi:hypothetical protein
VVAVAVKATIHPDRDAAPEMGSGKGPVKVQVEAVAVEIRVDRYFPCVKVAAQWR